MYLASPDFVVVDQGSAHTSQEMKMTVQACEATLEENTVETTEVFGVVERYHAPCKWHTNKSKLTATAKEAIKSAYGFPY